MREPKPASGRRYRPRPLVSNEELLQHVVLNGDPEQLYLMLPPLLWVDVLSAQQRPSNLCVQSAHALRHAYAGLGVPTSIQCVELAVTDAGGGGTRYGSPQPHYVGDRFVGHCILQLPQQGRLVDATVEQFPELALGMGPLILRCAAPEGQATPQALMVAQRGRWDLAYTPVQAPFAEAAYGGLNATAASQEILRENGLHILSWTLAMLSMPGVQERARQASAPRLNELLDAVQGLKWTPIPGPVDTFATPTGTPWRLGEVVPVFDSSDPTAQP